MQVLYGLAQRCLDPRRFAIDIAVLLEHLRGTTPCPSCSRRQTCGCLRLSRPSLALNTSGPLPLACLRGGQCTASVLLSTADGYVDQQPPAQSAKL